MSGPAPSIQYSWDGPGSLGAPDAGLYLRWNNATGRFEMASAGVSDHGGLTGLGDDDHAQYALLAGRSGGQTLIGDTASGGGLTLTSTSHATKGPITMSGASQVLAPAGTAAAPAVAVNDTNLGIYKVGSNSLGIATLGALRMAVDTANVTLQTGVTLVVTNGTAAAPIITFAGDTDTGFYRPAANYLSVATAGAERIRFTDSVITIINPTTTPFTPEATTKQAMVLKLLPSQTAAAIEVLTSTSAVLASISAAGGALAQSYLLVSSGVGSWGQAGSGCAIDSWDSVTIRTTVGAAQGNIGVTGTTAFLKIAGTNRILANGTGLGFFNATPVAKQAFIADPSGGATVDTEARTAITAVITALENYGLLATS